MLRVMVQTSQLHRNIFFYLCAISQNIQCKIDVKKFQVLEPRSSEEMVQCSPSIVRVQLLDCGNTVREVHPGENPADVVLFVNSVQ